MNFQRLNIPFHPTKLDVEPEGRRTQHTVTTDSMFVGDDHLFMNGKRIEWCARTIVQDSDDHALLIFVGCKRIKISGKIHIKRKKVTYNVFYKYGDVYMVMIREDHYTAMYYKHGLRKGREM